jgi:carbon monoxide dehydrogenase subunit G
MALVIEGEERIGAPIQTVWEGLEQSGNPQGRQSGCTALDMKSDKEMAATVVLKIGPIKATFGGEVTLSNINAPIPIRFLERARAASPVSPRAGPTSR